MLIHKKVSFHTQKLVGNKLSTLVLTIFLFASLSHWLVTPIYEIYDEGAHVGYIYHLRTHHGLPIYNPKIPWERQPFGQEAAQPPLYYVIEAIISYPFSMKDFSHTFLINPHAKAGIPKARDNHNVFLHDPRYEAFPWHGTTLAVHVMRLFSIAMALLTLLLIYRLAILFTGDETISLISMSVVAFNPAFTHIAAGVNNDWLVIPICTYAVLLMSRRIIQPKKMPSLRSTIWIAIVVSAGILSKPTGLLLLPLALVMLTWETITHRIRRRDFLVHVSVVLITVIAASGWWFVRNYVLYGDPMATVVHIWRWGKIPERNLWQVLSHEMQGTWIYFWGVFGAGTLILPDIALKWINAVSALALIGLGYYVLEIKSLSLSSQAAAKWLLLVVWGIEVVIGFLRWTTILPASQGRLLYPAISVFSLLFGIGIDAWRKTLPWKDFLAVTGVALGAIAVANVLTPWMIVQPAYTPPAHRVVSLNTPPTLPYRRSVLFGNSIMLKSFDVTAADGNNLPVSVKSGEKLKVQLELQAIKDISENFSMSLQVILPYKEKKAAQIDTYPGGGLLPTSMWTKGEWTIDTYELPVLFASKRPLRGTLQLSFYKLHGKKSLIWHDLESGTDVKDRAVVLTEIRLLPQVPLKVPETAKVSPIDFGGKIRLEGIVWENSSEGIVLKTYWRALQDVHSDYHNPSC